MIRRARLLAATCAALSLGASLVRAQAPARGGSAAPDLVLTGGKVFTADSLHPWAEAIAIRGDRILAVGANAEVRRLAGRTTREIALGGRVVIPGIDDAHDHLGAIPLGVQIQTSPSPTPDPTFGQVLDSLRRVVARTPADRWIEANVGLRVLDDTAARREALDRAAPHRKVVLWTWWGHGAVLSSAAMRALGIADSAADPLGGWYERRSDGRLTGRLDEYARWNATERLYSTLPESALVKTLRAFADSSLRMGVTSVQDMAGYEEPALTVRAFRDAKLPIRVRLVRWPSPSDMGRNEEPWNAVSEHPAPRVTVSGRKWIVDGTPLERNALQRQPYADGSHGRLNFPLDTVRAILAEALRPGAVPLHLHVVGDSATLLVLDAMEALAPDSVWRSKRLRIEHGPGIVGPAVARAKRFGIVIAQPRGGAPLRTWHDAGIPLAYGSDGFRNPFYHFMTAVTGESSPAEALTREEAATMLTRGSAYAERAEHEKGTLAPGMLADVAVLSQDIFTAPARALPGTTSVLTIVGGRIVLDELTSGDARAVRER